MKKVYLLLHSLLFLFSLYPIFSKMAGQATLFSIEFYFFSSLVFLILAIYAFFWQKIIKKLPLTVAFANKAVIVIWGMLWGIILFGEKISAQKAIGAVIIIAGVVLYAFSEKNIENTAGKLDV